MIARLTMFQLVILLLTALLTLYAGSGVRGTDQYWYIGDVENRLSGDTSYTSSIYFPGRVLREKTVQEPNYILHNGFMIPLAALVGQLSGAYAGWILLNFICHALISICIFWSSRKFLAEWESACLACLYLVSPVAVWQTINPLLEMSYAAVTALCVLGYVYRERKAARYLLSAALAIGVASHPIFLIPSAAWLILCSFNAIRFGAERRFFLVLSVATIAAAFLLKDWLFPSSFQPSLTAIIASAVPGKSNMFWHYSDTQPAVSFSFLYEKALLALSKHFLSLKFAPMFVFTNAALVCGVWLLLYRSKCFIEYLLPAMLFIGLYWGMLVLQQNHPRYQQIIAPVSFLLLALTLSQINLQLNRWIIVGALCMFLLMDGVIAHRSKMESIEEASDIAALKQASRWIGKDSLVVAVNVYPHNPINYVLGSRKLLSTRTDLLENSKIRSAVEIFGATHVVSTEPLTDGFPVNRLAFVESIQSRIYGELFFYTVN